MLALINTKIAAVVLAAGTGFDAKTNSSLPGTSVIRELVGGLMAWAMYAAVAAIVIGAAAVGLSNASHNPHGASRGKMLLLGGVVGLILIGGANAIGTTFYDMGKEI